MKGIDNRKVREPEERTVKKGASIDEVVLLGQAA